MTETATSPHYHHPSAARAPPPAKTPSASQNMPPFLSTPRLVTPLERQQSHPKAPSPNYFGFQSGDNSASFTDSGHHAKNHWSPPSSAVRSTAAASPSVMPVDQHPDFDAFRRQSEGKAFNLGGLSGNFKMNAPPVAKPKHGRTASRTSPPQPASKTLSEPKDMPPPPSRAHAHASLDPALAELSRSPKRVLSPGSAAQLEPVRKGAPPTLHGDIERTQSQPRFKLPLDNQDGPFGFTKVQRAETIPAGPGSNEPEQSMVTPQYVVNLMESKTEEILLLDLRVSTQYANSHIAGALNLCIPTTLLKRPSFNVQKLAETFKDEEQRSKFDNWRNSSYILVYDGSSAQLKDAQICVNTIKKFKSEGYEGTLYIVKGGFTGFSKGFPSHIDAGVDSTASASQQSGGEIQGPGILPVIGGCPMPATDRPQNPFFGNIRQNMDLIGGVGQIALKHPAKADHGSEQAFPSWLRNAAEDKDQGKRVSNKFEAIERREKKRMEDALSGQVSYNTGSTPRLQRAENNGKGVQIAGIEKGAKNRYNNIWPFEHSRVRLQGVPKAGCDYFNANFIQAAWSYKRYISTQAPIPATFMVSLIASVLTIVYDTDVSQDFWSVIWQQDVRVIVMLTAEKEGAQVKAHNYWDKKQYGPLHLEFLSEKRASLELARIHKHQQKRPGAVKRTSTNSSNPQIPLATLDSKDDKGSEQPYVIVRKFTLSHERHPFEPMREITQLQYSSWPDFGAPAHPAHLLGLVEQTDAVVRTSNKSHGLKDPEPEGSRPVMVHCSAGCGRTGTFCTVDSVLDMLKRQNTSRRQTRATPMEIDEKTPASSSEQETKQGVSGQMGKHASDGGFFASQYQHNAYDSEGIEGSWVQSEDVDLVEKTVEDFRRQRLSMVQSLRQYALCYESVMEWLVGHSPSSVEE